MQLIMHQATFDKISQLAVKYFKYKILENINEKISSVIQKTKYAFII